MSEISHCILLRETEKAREVEQRKPNRAVIRAWLPKSEMTYCRKQRLDGVIHIWFTIPGWLVDKAGLIE